MERITRLVTSTEGMNILMLELCMMIILLVITGTAMMRMDHHMIMVATTVIWSMILKTDFGYH